MLAEVVKRPTTARALITSEMTAAAGTIGTSWMSTGPPESDIMKFNSREDSSIHQGEQQHQQRQ
jgi:hypothetical protein